MKKEYFPKHNQNRMKNEGDVVAARKYFLTGKNRVLYHLVKKRYMWMNEYIKDTDKNIMELGCGAGFSKQFINNKNLILTDVLDNEWVDKYQDALNMDVPDRSQDVIICSNMLHHLANPACFFEHVGKKLKPGGRIIIQDIYTGALMKCVLRFMRHEGWSERIDVFDHNTVCNVPSDPWSANCSIPKLLFFNKEIKFQNEFPEFKMIKRQRNECLLFLLSGGVIAKTFYMPVGDYGAELIEKVDRILVKIAPWFFACACSVVLVRKEN